jgi:hypothetical protein
MNNVRCFAFAPRSTNGSGFTYKLSVDPAVDLSTALPPEKFCVFCPVGQVKVALEIEGEAKEEDAPIKISFREDSSMSANRQPRQTAPWKLSVDCLADTKSIFSLTVYKNDITDDQIFWLPQNEKDNPLHRLPIASTTPIQFSKTICQTTSRQRWVGAGRITSRFGLYRCCEKNVIISIDGVR